MRRMIFPVVLFLCAVALCACDVREMGSLSDFSRPYAGVYECRTLTLGGDDALEKFEYVRLELKGEGTFSLAYRTEEGKEGGVDGEYEMNTERGELTLMKKTPLRTVSHVCTVKDGTIFADFNFGGNLLHAEFAMP